MDNRSATPAEIEYTKYKRQGAYHWKQISRSISRHNCYVSARYEAVLSELGDVRGKLLLDIGGGDGVLSYLIAKQEARIVTVDTAQLALRLAREEFAQRGRMARFSVASAYALSFPASTFDIAICTDVIEHVQSPQRLLAEAARVLRPEGRFVLTTPLRVTETPLSRTHVREFFAGELKALLAPSFGEVTITAFAPLALLELFGLPFRRLGGRPLFRYLFNAMAIYLGRNPFEARVPFRYMSMLIATGRKKK